VSICLFVFVLSGLRPYAWPGLKPHVSQLLAAAVTSVDVTVGTTKHKHTLLPPLYRIDISLTGLINIAPLCYYEHRQ
jgi:hypothetical protein